MKPTRLSEVRSTLLRGLHKAANAGNIMGNLPSGTTHGRAGSSRHTLSAVSHEGFGDVITLLITGAPINNLSPTTL